MPMRDYASRFFKDPRLDNTIVSGREVKDLLENLKPQPLTRVRRTLSLDGWKAYGYREGEEREKEAALSSWLMRPRE